MPEETYTIEFVVNGLPPKKDGAISMWSKDGQYDQLVRLRKAAFDAITATHPGQLFYSEITLRIEIFMDKEKREKRRHGDLDNFISGICDGLMAESPQDRQPHDHESLWSEYLGKAIDPANSVAIQDDSAVISISAEKRVKENGEKDHYCIVICGHLKKKDSDAH